MWLTVGVVAVAVNLRPAVASVGPVLNELRRSLPLSGTAAAVLTACPVVCFGALAPVGYWLAARIGIRRAISVLSAALLAGLVLRLCPGGVGVFFAGTLLAAGGIAALNVITPAMVKLYFPERTGLTMGIYTTALTGAAAAAAGLTVPVERSIGHGWHAGLGIWAVLAAVGLVLWLPHSVGAREERSVRHPAGPLLRDRIAWLVTAYFGIQSLIFYSVLTWLPTLFTDHGYDAATAGALLSVSAIVQAPIALITPTVATRVHRQGGLVTASVAFIAAGLLGLLLAPTAAAWLWVVLLGIGQGSSFPLSLTIMVMRSPTPAATTQLSSMAQTFGYLLAALGPLLVGVLRTSTGGWSVSLLLLLVLLVPQLICGVAAGRPR